MKTYAVIGAGTMGSGIAQKIALEGSRVIVVDIKQEALDRGKEMMNAIFKESIQRKLLSEEQVNNIWNAISFTIDLNECQNAGFVIEAVFEDRKIKADIFSKLEDIVGNDTVIASNTSSFRITELAKTLRHPERFVGLHFFYHPVKNRLLEIIPGEKTSPQTLETAQRFCAMLGKVDIVCKDSPGFVVNRFFVPWLNESVRILAEGKATLDEIEMTAKKCFQLGMGPFELMNVTGVPIAVHALEGLAQELGDFYRPNSLLVSQAQKGLWPLEKETIKEVQPSNYVYYRSLGQIIATAATLIAEGTATPLDIDLGARVGLRWPEGPLSLYNHMSGEERQQVIDTFKERYTSAEFSFPQDLTAGFTFPLSNVMETPGPGNIAVLSLARPDHANAFNEAMFKDLDRAVERNTGAAMLILNGKGKNFAAGADIDFFIKNIENKHIDHIIDFTRFGQATLAKIDRFNGNVIAVVDGFALGGGAELMLTADVITAAPRSLIGFPETGIGIYPGLGGTYRLTQKVGEGLAKYLIGTGQLLNGKDAAVIGLVDACLAPEDMTIEWLRAQIPAAKAGAAAKRELTAKWQNIVDFMNQYSLPELLEKTFTEDWQIKIQAKLRSKAPIALRLAMELIHRAASCTYEEAIANELAHLEEIFNTEDALTGLKSVGKYRPVFKGK
ncbi:MAG: 3-hydroxyacyl-CoA dehydrogenase NAD-binding domain-containing protein [Acidobacteria bacterium]|nr:3-hydroxyacyl-CoA dehydrogenase NAD-binding domain-containing protein [Acidobacteriota bacterium]